MRIVAGIEELDTPGLFASARRRIILHAAVYGAFAKSEAHYNGLKAALQKPGFERVDIIAVHPQQTLEWRSSFLESLRFGISRQGITDEIELSHQFLVEFSGQYPDKVHLHNAHRLPSLPILVIDDTIIFGQYAHARIHAPQGFWGVVEADVETLLGWTKKGKPPTGATASDIAAFRLVNDCVRSMNNTSNPL